MATQIERPSRWKTWPFRYCSSSKCKSLSTVSQSKLLFDFNHSFLFIRCRQMRRRTRSAAIKPRPISLAHPTPEGILENLKNFIWNRCSSSLLFVFSRRICSIANWGNCFSFFKVNLFLFDRSFSSVTNVVCCILMKSTFKHYNKLRCYQKTYDHNLLVQRFCIFLCTPSLCKLDQQTNEEEPVCIGDLSNMSRHRTFLKNLLKRIVTGFDLRDTLAPRESKSLF